MLDINPPAIRVRDFGSKNGTYVNGKKIGQRQAEQTPEEGAKLKFPEYDLLDGDEIKLGNTVFTIAIEDQKFPNLDRQAEPQSYLLSTQHLLRLAQGGNNNLIPIRGYEILKKLGQGGFGEVYLAQHNKTRKFVALKVMLPAVAASDRAVERFLRETENTKALQHPNVLQLIDYGYCESIFFFTMEYCSGGSVCDLTHQSGGRLSIDVAVSIILQVLDGLEYTHHAEIPYVKLDNGGFGKGIGLVHRDLKPGNILLVNIGNKLVAKIGDYGLAKAFDIAGLSGQTLSGTQAGTPVFIPRQQVINFKYAQPDIDVWATAACFYYMLTGAYPRNFTNGDSFLAVLRNDPVPINQRNMKIPRKLAEVIDLALRDRPEIYFKSAVEFKQAMLNVL